MADNPLSNIVRYGFVPRGTSSGPQTLTASLVTNSNTFFAPTVSQPGGTATDYRHEARLVYGLNHSFVRFGRQPVGQAGSGTQAVSPPLFTDSDTFFAATVSQPGVSSTDYRHEPRLVYGLNHAFVRFGRQPVGQAGTLSLAPSLLVDGDTFFSPSISQPGVSRSNFGSGGYIQRPKATKPRASKPKIEEPKVEKPRVAKPKPLPEVSARLLIAEDDDRVTADAACVVRGDLHATDADDIVLLAAQAGACATFSVDEAADVAEAIIEARISVGAELIEQDDLALATVEITRSKWVSYDNDFLLVA